MITKFNDVSTIPDCAYTLAKLINGGHYTNIVYYEFHEIVNPKSVLNCFEGLEYFTTMNDKLYSIFLSQGFVDSEPAIIHIALRLGDEWIISRDCGANYYGGFGPMGIFKLREACYNRKILGIASTENFDKWLKSKFNLAKDKIKPSPKNEERLQFEKLIKAIQHLASDLQRRPEQFQSLTEENIRDRILTSLNIVFKGRGNAEAKNCKGKTDILIRTKDGLNEHIFELKVWKGIKSLEDTIQQLRKYLSWHNNHTGIIIFCYNSNFTNILNETKTYLKEKYHYADNVHHNKCEFRFFLEHPSDEYKRIETVLTLINLKI